MIIFEVFITVGVFSLNSRNIPINALSVSITKDAIARQAIHKLFAFNIFSVFAACVCVCVRVHVTRIRCIFCVNILYWVNCILWFHDTVKLVDVMHA